MGRTGPAAGFFSPGAFNRNQLRGVRCGLPRRLRLKPVQCGSEDTCGVRLTVVLVALAREAENCGRSSLGPEEIER